MTKEESLKALKTRAEALAKEIDRGWILYAVYAGDTSLNPDRAKRLRDAIRILDEQRNIIQEELNKDEIEDFIKRNGGNYGK